MRPRALALAAALALGASSCTVAPAPRPAEPPPARPGAVPPAAAPAGPLRLEGEPLLDVGLTWDQDSLVLHVPSRTALATGAGYAGAATGALRVVPGEVPGTLAYGNEEPLALLGAGDTLWVGDRDRPETSAALWNGRSWRGLLKVFVGPRGRITLASRLPLETYLLGVVPLEIGGLARDLLEAGRAQAIAARSYTLFYRGRRAAEGFDLFGTVEDQVYGPVEAERPLATECVERTRGQVALHEGRPIRANYCSTCGGVSAEVWEAWPAASLGYLESRRDADGSGRDYCAASPQYRWRETWTARELLDGIARFGPALGLRLPAAGPGELLDVQAEARSRSGRVWRLRVRTTTMDLAVPAYALRGVLRRPGRPEAILRSNLFKIAVRRDAAGRASEVIASGAGAGHGVGLCQTGALGRARAGVRAERILEHYYPRSEVRRLY